MWQLRQAHNLLEHIGKEEALRPKSGGFFVPENVVPKVRVELTQGHPYRFLSLVRAMLVSPLIVLANVRGQRLDHPVPSRQCWIPTNVTANYGVNKFGLTSSRVLANRSKAIERSRSASATFGRCLEFNSLFLNQQY